MILIMNFGSIYVSEIRDEDELGLSVDLMCNSRGYENCVVVDSARNVIATINSRRETIDYKKILKDETKYLVVDNSQQTVIGEFYLVVRRIKPIPIEF